MERGKEGRREDGREEGRKKKRKQGRRREYSQCYGIAREILKKINIAKA